MVKTVINIEGMMCPHCEAHMNEAIQNNFTVDSVVSSNKDNKTEVVSAEALDEDKVKEVVAEAGYEYKGMTVEA